MKAVTFRLSETAPPYLTISGRVVRRTQDGQEIRRRYAWEGRRDLVLTDPADIDDLSNMRGCKNVTPQGYTFYVHDPEEEAKETVTIFEKQAMASARVYSDVYPNPALLADMAILLGCIDESETKQKEAIALTIKANPDKFLSVFNDPHFKTRALVKKALAAGVLKHTGTYIGLVDPTKQDEYPRSVGLKEDDVVELILEGTEKGDAVRQTLEAQIGKKKKK